MAKYSRYPPNFAIISNTNDVDYGEIKEIKYQADLKWYK
jgi:hypothetical protein